MELNDKIYIAGHNGLVGSAILRKLKKEGYTNFILKTKDELDLTNQSNVEGFFKKEKPDYVFLCAAKVGGINANNLYGADFIYENIMIQSNVIHNSYLNNVKKLLFLGSSCVYPKNPPIPIKEEYLLTSELEKTNESYAIAKITGLKMCQSYNKQYGTNYICVMPTNLYGPNDNYDIKTSHVLPAMLYKFHDAKINNKPNVEIWGTGKPMREFLHVDDMVDACYFLMQNYNENEIINIGCGEDISISDLANLIKTIVGYTGNIIYNTNMPDGTYRKKLDISLLKLLGFEHKISLYDGIKQVYEEKFLKNI